jgi:LysM repeat protein
MLHLLKGRVAWRVAAVLMMVMAMALMPAVASANGGMECRVWHKVYAGENLSQIAARYGVDWWYLADYNHLSNPRVIVPGQKICIPPHKGHDGWDGGHNDGWDGGHNDGWDGGHDCWYKVQAGDNLSRIGARFGVPWPKLAKINDLESPWIVVPGQKIRLCY